jgi:hypothetical protein
MKQFTSENDSQDKIEIVKQTSIEKQSVFLGKVRPNKGHTMFEYNHKEKTIVEAVFDSTPALKFTDAMKGLTSLDKKITKKPDCIYVSALNKKNALKVLRRELNIDC